VAISLELIFSKVALEWGEEKFSGAALNLAGSLPWCSGGESKDIRVQILGFYPRQTEAD